MAEPQVTTPKSFDLTAATLLAYYQLSQQKYSKRHSELKIADFVATMDGAPAFLNVGKRSYGNLTLVSVVPTSQGQQTLKFNGKPSPYHKIVALGRGNGAVVIKVMRIGRLS